jgi:hypothetical protein
MKFDLFVEETMKRLSAGKTPSDIAKMHNKPLSQIKAQIKKGTKVEKEHGGKAAKARKVAMDHVVENPKYYSKLKQAKL